MSENKTQLQTNNARLASLITELEGKAAGGGGSVETCTVTHTTTTPAIAIYTILNNGVIDTIKVESQSTAENVVKNSAIYVEYTTWPDAISVTGGEVIRQGNLRAPRSAIKVTDANVVIEAM